MADDLPEDFVDGMWGWGMRTLLPFLSMIYSDDAAQDCVEDEVGNIAESILDDYVKDDCDLVPFDVFRVFAERIFARCNELMEQAAANRKAHTN